MMSFELRMILIYTIIFVIIGLFVWLFISLKNKKDKANINKDYDLSTNDESDPDSLTLSDYEEMDHYITIPSKTGTGYDSIDDFLNNFSYREDDYDVVDEEEQKVNDIDYTISINPIKMATKSSEVINILIGEKAYIFLANGNKLENGTKIVLKIDDKNYNGTVVRTNYERDLSTLTTLPRDLEVVKIVK